MNSQTNQVRDSGYRELFSISRLKALEIIKKLEQAKGLTLLIVFLIEILTSSLAVAQDNRQNLSQHEDVLTSLPKVDCLLIDSDGNIDDIRAIAILASYMPIAALVTTDGMQSAEAGAATLSHFIASLGLSVPIPVIRGNSRISDNEALPHWSWLAPARADMKLIDQALVKAFPWHSPSTIPKNGNDVPHVVAEAVKNCTSIGMIMLGPWSTFLHYFGFFVENSIPISFILSQGRSIDDPDNPTWDRINCKFDMIACRTALDMAGRGAITWVDLPDQGSEFPVNENILSGIGKTHIGRVLKTIMKHADILEPQQQWDDMPAIFVLRPDVFIRVGGHYEPAVTPERMQKIEIELLNGR